MIRDYLAGLFDAEGHVRIRRLVNKSTGRPTFCYTLSIVNTYEPLILKFSEIYPKNITTENRGSNRKLVFRLDYSKGLINSTGLLEDLLIRCNEKFHQLKCMSEMINSNDIEHKEFWYKEYMKSKRDFNQPLTNTPTPPYIAGLMDGDGYYSVFNCGRNLFTSILNIFSVGIEQRYLPIIKYIGNILESGVVSHKVDSPAHNPTYSVYSRDKSIVKRFLNLIKDHQIQDKTKAEIILEYISKLEKIEEESKQLLEKWSKLGPLKSGVAKGKQLSKRLSNET